MLKKSSKPNQRKGGMVLMDMRNMSFCRYHLHFQPWVSLGPSKPRMADCISLGSTEFTLPLSLSQSNKHLTHNNLMSCQRQVVLIDLPIYKKGKSILMASLTLFFSRNYQLSLLSQEVWTPPWVSHRSPTQESTLIVRGGRTLPIGVNNLPI